MIEIIDYTTTGNSVSEIKLYYDDCRLVIVLVIYRRTIYQRGISYTIEDTPVELKFYGLDTLSKYLKDAGVVDDILKQAMDDLDDTIKSFTVKDIMQGVTILPDKYSVVTKALDMLLHPVNDNEDK